MRLELYNIRYGVGAGLSTHLPVPGAGYVLGNNANLERLIEFLQSVAPDIVGLIEVDTGSIRTRNRNQAELIAEALGHNSSFETKYGSNSINQLLPILRKQGNAFLAAPTIHNERFHYFDTGIKRLIIDLIDRRPKPVMVGGDFNTFWGQNEIYLFQKATGLASANVDALPSYPARAPRKELDFILYQEGIVIEHFEVPDIQLSDHLPLICDFHVAASSGTDHT